MLGTLNYRDVQNAVDRANDIRLSSKEWERGNKLRASRQNKSKEQTTTK